MKHIVQTIELISGSKLLVINAPGSSRFLFGVAFRFGSSDVPKSIYELPHFLEHLILSDRVEDNPLSYDLEKRGIYFNAQTESHATKYIFLGPKAQLKETISIGLPRLFEFDPTDDTAEAEKNILVDEIEIDETLKAKWNIAFERVVNPNWCAREDRIKSINAIGARELKKYHRNNYTNANTRYILAGSFTAKEIKLYADLIEKNVNKYPVGSLSPLRREVIVRPTRPVLLRDKAAKKNYSSVGFLVQGDLGHYRPVVKMLFAIFESGKYARLPRITRELGLLYHIDGGYSVEPDYTYFEFSFKSSPDKVCEISEVLAKELKDICSGNVTDAEFVRAKGYLLGDLGASYESAIDLARWYGNDFIFDHELTDYEEFVKAIERIKKEDLINLARKIFLGNWFLVFAGSELDKASKNTTKVLKDNLG